MNGHLAGEPYQPANGSILHARVQVVLQLRDGFFLSKDGLFNNIAD
jgi:hypothetical protein